MPIRRDAKGRFVRGTTASPALSRVMGGRRPKAAKPPPAVDVAAVREAGKARVASVSLKAREDLVKARLAGRAKMAAARAEGKAVKSKYRAEAKEIRAKAKAEAKGLPKAEAAKRIKEGDFRARQHEVEGRLKGDAVVSRARGQVDQDLSLAKSRARRSVADAREQARLDVSAARLANKQEASAAAVASRPIKARPEDHEPARHEQRYAHLGDAKKSVASGHAARERGLDMPHAEAQRHLERWPPEARRESPEVGETRERLRKQLQRDPTGRELAAGLRSVRPPNRRAELLAEVEARAALAGHAASVTPGTAKVNLLPDSRQVQARRVEELQELAKLTHAPLVHPVNVGTAEGWRSHYHVASRTINMSTGAGKDTTWHEAGHHLEESVPSRLSRAAAFLDARTSRESAQRLKDLLPGSRYRGDETAKPDGFYDPYVGSMYKYNGRTLATEVTSMGIQKAMTSPGDFYRKDPEHFLFTLGQLGAH